MYSHFKMTSEMSSEYSVTDQFNALFPSGQATVYNDIANLNKCDLFRSSEQILGSIEPV